MDLEALARLRAWMGARGFARFYVARPENFAWLTGGVNALAPLGEGVGYLEVGEGIRLHTTPPEHPRLVEEEALGLEAVLHPWYALPPPPGPSDLEHDLTPLRLVLTQRAQAVFRALGAKAARAVGEVVRTAQPRWRERTLAGALAEALWGEGIRPLLLLVAGEERLFRHRHPLPKDRPLGRAFMAVVCAEAGGLVASLTRMAAFGQQEVEALYKKVLRVEAEALSASRPGASLGAVLEAIRKGYEAVGHPGAFLEHHQGGVAGFRPRETFATPGHPLRLEPGMALAWNPSLPGAKVEDTFLLRDGGLENLTEDPFWPGVEVEGRRRPDLWRG